MKQSLTQMALGLGLGLLIALGSAAIVIQFSVAAQRVNEACQEGGC